ncbi:unnamed protein product [[Candida] boidinii]|uniref:tRNA(His) guanylyltransferase n=1 Tax=Candida boidinii TaxID=5477 RepID=A0A9W6T3T7_CANBO|nr:hypothetical protein BVG19_g685 [[Candida] boidinii]OWB49307.1 nucleotide binding protein [[Candida] boidinii]OWB67866.1 nucleotide binding protein [[Candida] boidinii]OWB85379.1 nucleotide binding protein [[Candida] boidinii]GME73648.1 unnamed protein product [[Candida] boidinii]
MANSKYEYVKFFEKESTLIPETYIIIRVDGRGFHKLSDKYGFKKPNDHNALELMNISAQKIMENIPDVVMAYGDSDEYSFLLRKNCELFERREFKLITTFSSTFTAYYQFYWSSFFPETPLEVDRLPTFDARAVVYPNAHNVRDYFSWRQVDCHINNLYNTTFWNLILKGGMTAKEAENRLKGSVSADKHEILFKQFNINYNNEPEVYKKGSVFVREIEDVSDLEVTSNDNLESGSSSITSSSVKSKTISPYMKDALSKRQKDRIQKKLRKSKIRLFHCDIIRDEFWDKRPWLLI